MPYNKSIGAGSDSLQAPKSITHLDRIDLAPDENSFSVRVAAISYRSPNAAHMRYKLEGFDSEWHRVSNNTISYSNLPFRSYRLVVEGLDSKGAPNGIARSLEIRIRPPFYLSGIAYACYAALALTTVVLLYRLANRRTLRKRETEIEKIERSKERELYVAKFDFFTNIAHEIRTPLNSIVGFSNLLASEKDLDEADKLLFAKTINQSCDLLLVLINDILEVSRLQSGQMKFEKESCSVKELVDDLYLAHQLLVPTLLRFSKEAEGDLFIYTDKKRLSQVITNFLTNACKFTNSGYIKLGFKHLRGTDEAAIFVEDSGIGLSEEEQEKVFSRFFKQDEFSQGAGLGLSICQGIVQNLGGRIALSSKQGEGSRFSVVLPVYKGG